MKNIEELKTIEEIQECLKEFENRHEEITIEYYESGAYLEPDSGMDEEIENIEADIDFLYERLRKEASNGIRR